MARLILAFFAALGFLLVAVVFGLIAALPVMWLWNALFTGAVTTALFGTATLSFWQALGLSILCGALFKSSGGSSSK